MRHSVPYPSTDARDAAGYSALTARRRRSRGLHAVLSRPARRSIVTMKLRYHEQDPMFGTTYWCSPQPDHHLWNKYGLNPGRASRWCTRTQAGTARQEHRSRKNSGSRIWTAGNSRPRCSRTQQSLRPWGGSTRSTAPAQPRRILGSGPFHRQPGNLRIRSLPATGFDPGPKPWLAYRPTAAIATLPGGLARVTLVSTNDGREAVEEFIYRQADGIPTQFVIRVDGKEVRRTEVLELSLSN